MNEGRATVNAKKPFIGAESLSEDFGRRAEAATEHEILPTDESFSAPGPLIQRDIQNLLLGTCREEFPSERGVTE